MTLEIASGVLKGVPDSFYNYSRLLTITSKDGDITEDIKISDPNLKLFLDDDEVDIDGFKIEQSSYTLYAEYNGITSNTITIERDDDTVSSMQLNCDKDSFYRGEEITESMISITNDGKGITDDEYWIFEPEVLPYKFTGNDTSPYTLKASMVDKTNGTILLATKDVTILPDERFIVTKEYLESQLKLEEYHEYLKKQLIVPVIKELTLSEYEDLEENEEVESDTLYLITE